MKLLFTIPFTILSFWLAAQVPLNDECAGAIDIGVAPYCSSPGQYSNVNATTSTIDPNPQINIPSCFNNNADRDVWFRFSLPADGSITDVKISVFGNINSNGTLLMPELALYRGDCSLGGLAELACVAAPLNINEVSMDFLGLSAGETYYLRINDYSATAAPNAGTFKLCVEKYVADFKMGEVAGTESCSGTLRDSGGESDDYSSEENLTFTICPLDFHQCIQINLIDYFTEEEYDHLRIYEGNGISGALIADLDGIGSNEQINVSGGGCATIQFVSDESVTHDGFHLTWQCTADKCPPRIPTPPSAATCDAALQINGCSQTQPNIVTLAPGQGDIDFIIPDVNAGCIAAPSEELNFAFFYFTAQADGEFGFLVKNGDPMNPSDIDFNVWGPIANVADICDFVSSNQPIRSSWTAGPTLENPDGLTGLTNTNPYSGAAINDEFDCGDPTTPGTGNLPTDDSFVKTIPVLQGEIYVVLLDDYDGAVASSDGISIDFTGSNGNILAPNTGMAVTVSDDVSVCPGESVELLATGGLGYAWFNGSTTLSCDTCANPIATTFETIKYTVKIATVCALISDSVKVSVLSLDLGPDRSTCLNLPVKLNENGLEGDYKWTGSAAVLLNCDTCASPVFTSATSGTYMLIGEVCNLRDTILITVAAAAGPDVALINDDSICAGDKIRLVQTLNNNYTYTWSSNPPNLVPVPANVSFAPTASASYFLEVSSPGCPQSVFDTVRIDVVTPPVYDLPAEGKKCAGDVLTLNLLNDPTVTQWTWSSNPAMTIDQVAQPQVTLTALGIDKPVSFFLEASKSGCTVRDTFKMLVTGPGLSVSPDDTICLHQTIGLKAEADFGPGSFMWSNGQPIQAISVTPEQTTTYTVSYQLNGCTFRDSVTIVVDGVTPDIGFPKDVSLCPGDSVLLNSIHTPGATYAWTTTVNSVVTPVSNPDAHQVLYQTTKYTVVATSADGCSITQNLTVTVLDPKVIQLTSDFTTCAGTQFEISATGNTTGTYIWTETGFPNDILYTTPSFKNTLNEAQTFEYNLHFSVGSGNDICSVDTSVTVTVLPSFTIVIIAEPDTNRINAGESVTLEAQIPSVNTNGFTYKWTDDSNNVIGTTPEITHTAVTTEDSVEYTYTVTVTSPNGCSQTKKITFLVLRPKVEIPNAFTPNGDGYNDFFRLKILAGKVTVEHLEIYSRWGQKVFESFDANAQWDGQVDGKPAPSDVYIYRFRYRRSDGSLVLPPPGEVTLIR